MQDIPLGVHSEVGQLRKVMVCAPGLAHSRLTPGNCDRLLFDDVMWVERARQDHLDFINKMRGCGVDVVEMHDLLWLTVRHATGSSNSRLLLMKSRWVCLMKHARSWIRYPQIGWLSL